jgi:hypothetical protein
LIENKVFISLHEWNRHPVNPAGATTNNKQQTTNNEQQTTNNKQQTTNNKQRTTNNEQTTLALIEVEGNNELTNPASYRGL